MRAGRVGERLFSFGTGTTAQRWRPGPPRQVIV